MMRPRVYVWLLVALTLSAATVFWTRMDWHGYYFIEGDWRVKFILPLWVQLPASGIVGLFVALVIVGLVALVDLLRERFGVEKTAPKPN